MLRRLFRGPLSGQDREIPDGAEVYEVPFVSVPGGTREVGDDTKPSGYWLYSFSGTKWVFAGIKDATSVDPPITKSLQDYCEVDKKGTYVLENGDVFEVQDQDISGLCYGLHRGFLCVVRTVPETLRPGVYTVKAGELVGAIVDEGSWFPASFSDLNFAPIRARFYIGTTCVEGMLAGVRHTEKGWRWIASSGDEFEHCQVIKRLSELPF